MDQLKTLLGDYLKEHKLDIKMDQYRIFEEWDRVVGEQISREAKPDFIKHNTLWIRVKNPVWKTELNFMKQDLMKKIAHLTNGQIKQIKII